MKKKRKKLRIYIVTYEPDDCYDYVTVRASSPERAKEIAIKREGLDEFQILDIVPKGKWR